MRLILIAVCAAQLGGSPGARAEVTLPIIIGSNMVLQREMEPPTRAARVEPKQKLALLHPLCEHEA